LVLFGARVINSNDLFHGHAPNSRHTAIMKQLYFEGKVQNTSWSISSIDGRNSFL